MSKKQANLSYWFIVGIAALAAAFSVLWTEQKYERELAHDLEILLPSRSATENKYTLIEVDFGNGQKRYFQGQVGEYQYTFSEALDSAANNGKFSLTVRNGDIAELAGIYDSGGSWKVYLNGREQKAPVDKFIVSAGEKYVLKYE